MTSYICVNIGCSSFLSIGILAARTGDSTQRLATTGIVYLGLFSLLRLKAPTAGSGTPPLTKPNQKDFEVSSFPPLCLPNSIYLNITWHWEATKKEEEGRSACKATVEGEEGREKKKRERDVLKSFLWTKESVVQMFVGKRWLFVIYRRLCLSE